MRSSFKSAVNDPLIRNMIRFAAVIVAAVLAAIGIKTLMNYFKK